MAGTANQRAARKRVRRVIAEDSEWTLATVPTLRICVLRYITRGFADRPVLRELRPLDQVYVLRHLATDLPVSVTAGLIDDQDYWKRCCKSRWPTGDVADHGRNWKRMYLERHVAEYVETHLPGTPDDHNKVKEMQALLTLCGPYVEDLLLRQLLPPIKRVKEEKQKKKTHRKVVVPLGAPRPASTKEGKATPATPSSAPVEAEEQDDDDDADDDDSPDEDYRPDHFDIGIALRCLPKLKKLDIVYQVRDVGMNFDWSLFQFTRRDCSLLAHALQNCHSLTELRVSKSGIDCHRARVLFKYLKKHTGLRKLDLSFNKIRDQGGKVLCKLLRFDSPVPLEEFILSDNLLDEDTGLYLGNLLRRNYKLKRLSLSMNNIGDSGCQAVVGGLAVNKGLEEINMSACTFGHETVAALREVLENNRCLKKMDLSCNRFGAEHAKLILEGLTSNPTIIALDLRLCEIGQENEYQINQMLKTNMEDQGIMPKLQVH